MNKLWANIQWNSTKTFKNTSHLKTEWRRVGFNVRSQFTLRALISIASIWQWNVCYYMSVRDHIKQNVNVFKRRSAQRWQQQHNFQYIINYVKTGSFYKFITNQFTTKKYKLNYKFQFRYKILNLRFYQLFFDRLLDC